MTELGAATATDADTGVESSPLPIRTNSFPVAVWIVVAALGALYPGLEYQSLFAIYAFRLALYASTTAILAAFTLAVGVALYFLAFKRDFRRSAGVATVITVALFSWPRLTAVGEWVASFSRIRLLREVIPVLLVAALMWLAVRYANRDRFILVLLGTLVGLLIVAGAGLPERVVAEAEVPTFAAAPGPKRTVVVLVLDGYGRADVLASLYGFDNSVFLDALTERGFRIRDDALTNYSVTHASLPSMIDLGYPFEAGVPLDAQLDPMRRLLAGDGTIIHQFAGAGYETVVFENAWAGSLCGQTPSRCHRAGLVGRSVWALGQMSPLAAVQSATVPNPFTAVSLRHIRELGDAIEEDASAPRFVLAHALIPHPPTQLSPTCDPVVASDRTAYLLSAEGSSEEDRAKARSRYVDQMQCVNSEVIASVDRLIAADEDVEIVIISDHGPDSQGQYVEDADWTDAALLERMAVLSAVRMPDQCDEPEPALTTVNTLRRAVACALGTDLVELPDRSFVAPAVGDIGDPVVDVTDRIALISGTFDR